MQEQYKPFKFMYHITTEDALESIIDKGLVPQIGSNCKRSRDKTPPMVFLSRAQDVLSWARCFSPKYNIVIELDMEDYFPEEGKSEHIHVRYNTKHARGVKDYGCDTIISPQHITEVYKIERAKYSEDELLCKCKKNLSIS